MAGAEDELERSAAALASGGDGADEAYAAALDGYLAAGGPDFDARMRAVCDDLGLPQSRLDLPTRALSGGQAARASLAAILLARFDVFLLDEPTNDLDFAGLARLEQFLADIPGAVVLVEPRPRVPRTARSPACSSSTSTPVGVPSTAVAGRDTSTRARQRAVTPRSSSPSYQSERARLEARARTQRQWAVQGVRAEKRNPRDNDKAQRDFRLNRTEKQAGKAKATERALERLDVVEKPWEGWDLRYQLADAARSGDVVMRLEQVVIERGSFRLGPVDLEIGWGERVAIVGPNGSGKTTLLLALLGRLPLTEGRRYVGPGVIIGEMDQARATFAVDGPLIDAFTAATGLVVSEARSLLAKFGLSAEHVLRSAATLSPGERTRAVLAQFAAQGVNCLVLDEPTNHLDLPAIEQLEAAVEGFEGTLLLVSHDRRLLDVVRTTRALTPQGAIVAAQ